MAALGTVPCPLCGDPIRLVGSGMRRSPDGQHTELVVSAEDHRCGRPPAVSRLWRTELRESGAVAVWPIGDTIEHDIDSPACVCGPQVELRDGGRVCLVTHEALDGRP